MVQRPDVFSTPFFRQHPPGRKHEITDHTGAPRVYTFPTLFTHSPTAMLLFTADLARVRAHVAPSGLEPVRVAPDRCLVAIASYSYGAISDGMKPYNELALGIPVSTSRVPLVPALLRSAWRSFGVFVLDLPVDSAENCRRGVEIWGLPKTMKTFNYEDVGDQRMIELRDGNALCMRVTFARGGRPRTVAETNQIYSMKNGRLLSTRVFIHGAAWEYTPLSPLAARCSVEFGTHGLYSAFAGFDLSSRPVLVREFAAASTALYLPEDAR